MPSGELGNPEDVSAGMKRANAVRKQWLATAQAGEVSFQNLVDLSKLRDEHRYLSSIKLLDILQGTPGWTSATAREALSSRGFSDKDTLKSIRASSHKVERFAQILELGPHNWRARPEFPRGWPFHGKLYEVFRANDFIDVSWEMQATLGPGPGDSDFAPPLDGDQGDMDDLLVDDDGVLVDGEDDDVSSLLVDEE